ncbi:hypothetical protein B4U80_10987 [Leptotrombidium deliense]|uniref:C2H2-type domain-containing protein n=1 Tax=Leptotrombidium deliense TaxID=299467 RepID=A0A443SGG0_9ACAR|nr:hypothetical protein B4U80_10987 [Leptotrombidium deliense]
MREKHEKPDAVANASNVDIKIGEEPSKSSKSSRYTKRPPNERRFPCSECERKFFTRKDVKRHMVVHTGVRNFACPDCQQRFGRKDHLVRHAKKSHNRDTRTSASYTVAVAGNRRGSFTPHSTAPLPAVAMPNTSPSQGDSLSHSPCNYTNVSSPLEQPSFLLLGNSNGHNSNICCNASNSVSAPMNVVIGEPSFVSAGLHHVDDVKHGSACESMYTNGAPHYFSFPAPSNYMGPTYIPPGFAPNANNVCTNNGSSHPGAAVCAEHPSIGAPTFASHDVSSSLPHFNQIFQ